MKKESPAAPQTRSDPVKILLHMVKIDGDWSGKASDFGRGEEYHFRSLSELLSWLRRRK